MRPALQRLLSRPSSLELLRFLVGTPGCTTPAVRTRNSKGNRAARTRGHVSLPLYQDHDLEPVHGQSMDEVVSSTPADAFASQRKDMLQNWHEGLWTLEQLEYESDLESASGDGRRLLDQVEYRQDMGLWLCLLSYRKRVHGDVGVMSFWNTIRRRSVVIPTGSWARSPGGENLFWSIFVALGVKHPSTLEQIVEYANDLWKLHKQRWVRLYVSIVQHFLVEGDGRSARKWHEQLLPFHPPNQRDFAEMCRQVTLQDGDMKTLREIYRDLPHRNAYSKIVPKLCAKERFKDAYHWHLFFIENGDLPASSKLVEPLMQYLAIYDRPAAIKVTKSLVSSGVSFASTLSTDLEDNTKISREMMNLIHGKTFNITQKKYNDDLGARWFATGWVSLNTAINSVHALGVQEIGPLSLQAICLRESDAKAIVIRIAQLRDLGISLGTSLYARAIEYFARNREVDHLHGLLHSDQHPDQLDDGKLQEQLLSHFARVQDWGQYRRTLAIRSLAAKDFEVENKNLVLRSLITTGDEAGATEYLKQMQNERVPVKARTTAHILQSILQARRVGRRPMVPFKRRTTPHGDDLSRGIDLLRSIMFSGSYVPATLWREILRRLGMLGRLTDLRKLCMFLAQWYGPSTQQHRHTYRVPVEVPTSHPLHPFKVLFSPSLQKAIVEWGFIHTLAQDYQYRNTKLTSSLPQRPLPFPDVSCGIAILKQLHEQGVHIDRQSVRKALLHRLLIYYGPGTSNRSYNRLGKMRMRGKLKLVAREIDEVLGGDFVSGTDLPRLVSALGSRKLEALERRRVKKLSVLASGDEEVP